jgi:hypothetical protein
MNVGHDIANMDPVTNVPLAARVCYNMAGLPFSFQTDKFQDILGYTEGNVGPLLATLCGFMWLVKVHAALPQLIPARPSPIADYIMIRCHLSPQ